jgi:hypothetical protein
MRKFLIVIVILIILFYLRYYVKYNQDIQIVQVYLDNFKLDTLYEKNPIVIYDQVYNIDDLFTTIFAYSYAFQTKVINIGNSLLRNSHKYLLLYSTDSDVSIRIINPKNKKHIVSTEFDKNDNINYVTIKLKEKQILILPALWYYQSKDNSVKSIGLDDIISKWLYRIF